MGAAASTDDVGIAGEDVDVLDRQAEQIGDNLRETSFVPLAAGLSADNNVDEIGRNRDFCALLRRTYGRFDIVRQTAPKQLAAICGVATPHLEAIPIGDTHRQVHVGLVLTTVVGHADRVRVWHRLRPNEIHTAQLYTVEA